MGPDILQLAGLNLVACFHDSNDVTPDFLHPSMDGTHLTELLDPCDDVELEYAARGKPQSEFSEIKFDKQTGVWRKRQRLTVAQQRTKAKTAARALKECGTMAAVCTLGQHSPPVASCSRNAAPGSKTSPSTMVGPLSFGSASQIKPHKLLPGVGATRSSPISRLPFAQSVSQSSHPASNRESPPLRPISPGSLSSLLAYAQSGLQSSNPASNRESPPPRPISPGSLSSLLQPPPYAQSISQSSSYASNRESSPRRPISPVSLSSLLQEPPYAQSVSQRSHPASYCESQQNLSSVLSDHCYPGTVTQSRRYASYREPPPTHLSPTLFSVWASLPSPVTISQRSVAELCNKELQGSGSKNSQESEFCVPSPRMFPPRQRSRSKKNSQQVSYKPPGQVLDSPAPSIVPQIRPRRDSITRVNTYVPPADPLHSVLFGSPAADVVVRTSSNKVDRTSPPSSPESKRSSVSLNSDSVACQNVSASKWYSSLPPVANAPPKLIFDLDP